MYHAGWGDNNGDRIPENWYVATTVTLVSNQHLRIPQHPLVDKVVGPKGLESGEAMLRRTDAPAVPELLKTTP